MKTSKANCGAPAAGLLANRDWNSNPQMKKMQMQDIHKEVVTRITTLSARHLMTSIAYKLNDRSLSLLANIPEEGGDYRPTKNSQPKVTLADISIDRNDSPKFRLPLNSHQQPDKVMV